MKSYDVIGKGRRRKSHEFVLIKELPSTLLHNVGPSRGSLGRMGADSFACVYIMLDNVWTAQVQKGHIPVWGKSEVQRLPKWETSQMSIYNRMDKLQSLHTMEYNMSIKMNYNSHSIDVSYEHNIAWKKARNKNINTIWFHLLTL